MSKRGIWKYFVLTVLMLSVCGCGRPNLIGTDAAVYSRGALYAVASQDLNSVYAATVTALKQLEVEVIETAKDVFYAKVVGKIADGKTITIRMEPGEKNITEITIKASKFLTGNEERARVVYTQIKLNL
ncbi:MAG: DUF3568 family protein [Planctomycetes bacterium]|jgi:hypothetical protein|nr:DUF3568 family protein [Planctomycetota bacterium]MBL7146506.1 DUF3568 family protein [Phycisphaerae bacterium]